MNKIYIFLLFAFFLSASLFPMGLLAQEKDADTLETDKINLPLNRTIEKRALTGAVSKVSGRELLRYPDLSLSNTFQGQLPGVYVRSTSSGLGNNTSSLFVRGLSRGSADGALTLVDGIERPIDFIHPEEIESIEVLKDASTKIIYGPRAANGVILITTKRGRDNTRSLSVSAEYGMSSATRLPKFLDSYQYVQLYNEARANDGLSPFYSAEDIEGYRNSSGPNDQMYPNIDFYNYFLNKSVPIKRASVSYTGGGSGSKYALVLGYTGAKGFEKVGQIPSQDRINLRGNLDFQISSGFKAFVDAAGIVEKRVWTGLGQNEVFSALNTHRPNEYPIFITDPALTDKLPDLGLSYVPPLGGSFLRPSNLLGNLEYGGDTEHNFFYGQTNFGLDLDLNKVVKGFSVKAVLNVDNYQFFQSGRSEAAPTYSRQVMQNAAGQDTVVYVNLIKRVVENNDVRQGEDITRNYGLTGTISYQNKFENSSLNGSLTHFYYKNEDRDSYQDIENTNTVLNMRYSYKDKFYADGSLALMGSNKLADDQKYQLFPAIGLGWILSEENFLNNSSSINFLKLKSSFGILGYDRATAFYQFESRWYDNGTYSFNEPGSANNERRSSLSLIGNPNLGWEKSREFNIGIEGAAFKSLSFEFNYFNDLRYDMIINPGNIYSSVAGGLFPFQNRGETANAGIDGTIRWNKKVGAVDLTLGANFIYSKNDVKVNSEIIYKENNLNMINLPSDVIFGYVSKGLFTSQQQVDASPVQTFGQYGVGDIAYEDLNGDNIIDARDIKAIGNNFPRTSIGADVNLKFKNFGLYLLGTSELGVDNMLSNNYYRNNAESKYSDQALNRYHPTNNPDGTMPRLTTYNGVNNNAGSTFWIQSANFFRLKNAELSYDVATRSSSLKNYRFFVRGTNVFVLSDNKDLDPEVINAGVTNYPIYKTFTFGASVRF